MMLERDASELLPEDVPVTMPELPATLRVDTAQQFKAVGDATRSLILHILKHEPVTASQIGARLNIPPGTVGHHLQVLEAAGLAQIVARRLVHGIVVQGQGLRQAPADTGRPGGRRRPLRDPPHREAVDGDLGQMHARGLRGGLERGRPAVPMPLPRRNLRSHGRWQSGQRPGTSTAATFAD
jgi:hypothetical protein